MSVMPFRVAIPNRVINPTMDASKRTPPPMNTPAPRRYRGDIDTPKTRSSKRTVAIPSKTASLMQEWLGLVEESPDAWVFSSENAQTPMWRDNIWYRGMKPKLKPLGLDRANFQVLRRTHASLGHEAPISAGMASGLRWTFTPRPRLASGPKQRNS